MLGELIRNCTKDVNTGNGFIDTLTKVVLPEAADVVEIGVVSTATFFGWTAAVNHAADKKLAAEKAKEAQNNQQAAGNTEQN